MEGLHISEPNSGNILLAYSVIWMPLFFSLTAFILFCVFFFFNLNNMGFFHRLLKKEGGKELIISELKCNHGPIK